MKNPSTRFVQYIFIALVAGLALGLWLHHLPPEDMPWVNAYITQGILAFGAMVFITSIKLLVVPLIAISLIYAMTRLGDVKHIGRLGFKTLSLYLLTSVLAIVLAIVFATFFHLGKGVDISVQAMQAKSSFAFVQVLTDAIPKPILDVILGRKLLSLIIVSIIVGYLLHFLGAFGKRCIKTVEKLNEGMLHILMVMLHFTPIGVFCLTAQSFAYSGFDMIGVLLKYMSVMLLVLFLHVTIISTVLLRLVSHLSVKTFFQKMMTPMLVAFGTTSSNVALPVSMETVHRKLGVSQPITSFTMPLGATLNMDGGAVLQGMATIFIANYYGIDFSMIDYCMIVIAALIATIGTAGVPNVGPVMLVFVLQWVGLPLEGIGLILGVDKFLEMFRTTVNITGDAIIACVVAKSEKALDLSVYRSPSRE